MPPPQARAVGADSPGRQDLWAPGQSQRQPIPDGRLFRGARGGMLSESVYGRAWHAARQAALGPGLAATALARRPYDLRHAALSLWLNATGAPAEVAARAGNSARVLHEVYLHCTDRQDDTVSQQIQDAIDADARVTPSSRYGKASGYTHRRHHPGTCPLTCIAAVFAGGSVVTGFTVREHASVLPCLDGCQVAASERPGQGARSARVAAPKTPLTRPGGK